MAVKKSSSEKGASRKKSAVQNGGKPVLVEYGSQTSGLGTDPATISIETEIRRRAYEIYESRGRQDGLDRDDWIQAEAEILSRHKQSA